MTKYLMIASRDPFDSNDAKNYYDMAADLAQEGNEVTLFLVQNGVLPARRSAASGLLTEVAKSGVSIFADDFSLRERGIDASRLVEGVKARPLDLVIDEMAAGAKTIWH